MGTKRSSTGSRFSAERRQFGVENYGAYPTTVNQEPKVRHTDADCPAGQQIESHNLEGETKKDCASSASKTRDVHGIR